MDVPAKVIFYIFGNSSYLREETLKTIRFIFLLYIISIRCRQNKRFSNNQLLKRLVGAFHKYQTYKIT